MCLWIERCEMKYFVSGALLALSISTPAFAQFNGGMDWVVNRTRVPTIIQCPDCDADGDEPGEQTKESEPQKRGDISQLSYQISLDRRMENMRRFVTNVAKADPSAPTQDASQLAELLPKIDQMMRPMGLRADNVADAYAVWWIAAWEAVNKKMMGNDVAMHQAVKRQAAEALLATPLFGSSGDALKQEMAESLLIQTVMISAAYEGAAGNPTQQTVLATAVNQGAQQMGLDLTKMNLTEKGFVPR